MTATGRVAWAKGQCHTTGSGAEGGLNDTAGSIAHGCKAGGKTCLAIRKDHHVLRCSHAAGDGTHLPGGTALIDWRWPGGTRVTCTGN